MLYVQNVHIHMLLSHLCVTLLLLSSFSSSPSTQANALVTPSQNTATKQKFDQAAAKGSVIFIDVENVRGKSGFKLTHANVIEGCAIWAKEYGLDHRLSLLVDHGSIPSGYYLQDKGLSVIFAGTSMKADDVIVRDVPFCQNEMCRDVVVVTADTELIQRCKSAANRSRGGRMLSIINPIFFLADFDAVVGQSLQESSGDGGDGDSKSDSDSTLNSDGATQEEQSSSSVGGTLTSGMEKEITQGARLIAIESQLRNKGRTNKNVSPKKRKKLKKQAEKIRAKLGLYGPSTLKQVTSIMVNDGWMGGSNSSSSLDAAQQKELLKKWKSLREASGRREMTGDRILLSEGLRRELENLYGSPTATISDPSETLHDLSPSERHAIHANALIHGMVDDGVFRETGNRESSQDAPSHWNLKTIKDGDGALRLVVISDTHGCEKSLTDNAFESWSFTQNDLKEVGDEDDINDDGDRTLPEGDLLLHLGDFAIDRGGIARRNAIARFDKWMSLQPHPLKIVLRGNHDPYNAEFPLSKAEYITTPSTVSIGNKTLTMIPYGFGGFSTSRSRRSSSTSLLPSTCDILATHEPPYNILDKCLSGERAGSSTIRTAVENMKGLPPKLWLCGHIHEGRGSMQIKFGNKHDSRETMVINAANANPGRANHLVYGPTIIDVSDDIGIVDSGGSTPKAKGPERKLQRARAKRHDEQELVLAVDLGLKCGASLFDDKGNLLRYEQLRFQDPEDLYKQAPSLIKSWERKSNDQDLQGMESLVKKRVISYLAVEGGGELLDAWESALEIDENKEIQLVSVRPEEWRSRLLLPKERESSRSCKEAARQIARQIVSNFGTMDSHQGKFKTDAAESVAVGYYFANTLGWVHREPIVSRYTNGKIIVPK